MEMMKKVDPFSSFLQMTDFFPPYTLPIFMCPDQLSVSPLEPASPVQPCGQPAHWGQGVYLQSTILGDLTCIPGLEAQLPCLFFQAILSLAFRLSLTVPHCSTSRRKFTSPLSQFLLIQLPHCVLQLIQPPGSLALGRC